MKIRLIVVWMVFLGALPLSAQDWSSWTTANNRDFQYRWLGSAPSESGSCYLQDDEDLEHLFQNDGGRGCHVFDRPHQSCGKPMSG